MRNTLRVRWVWLIGLWFAILGMIPTFLRVHVETLRVLPSVLRSLDASGLPVPETLAWSSALVRWIATVGGVPPLARLLILFAVYLVLLSIALRVALPSPDLRGADTSVIWRAVALLAGWLVLEAMTAWWLWGGKEQSTGEMMLFIGMICLITALLLSEDGIAGWWLRRRASVNRWSLVRLAVGGFACGSVGALVLQFTSFEFGAALYHLMFDFPTAFAPPGVLQGLADLNPRGWLTFTLISLAIAAGGSFCWGSLWTAIVAPAQSYHQRVRAFAAAVVPLALVTLTGVWLFYGLIIGRLDYRRSLPDLAQREQIPVGRAGSDTVFIPIAEGRVRIASIPFQTIVGFPNEPGVTYKVEQYLRTRRYQTVLARLLFVYLHDVRSIDWDPLRSLEVDELCIERAPRLQFVQLMVETLSHCAVTPEAKRYLDWLDARCRPFRQSQRACQTMGDLYARFGDERKAQEWYQRGEIPEELRKAPQPTGKITGSVLWNGQLAKGVRLGIMSRQNALPFTREPQTAQTSVLIPRPFDWRVVAGVVATDESGRFEFPPMPYGEYVLLLRVESRRMPPLPGAAQIEGLPAVLQLRSATKDVGTIRLRETGQRPARRDRAI